MSKKAPDNTLLKSGDIVKDTYIIDRYIGEGAFAEVYRVKHKFLGLQALKVLKPIDLDNKQQNSLAIEAMLLSHLTHPNIVRVFEANSFKKNNLDLFFIAMEYVSGETLFQLIKRKSKIPISLVLSIQRDICAGLSIAHKQNPPILHRDIKPQNILLSYDTDIPIGKVSDFGVAKIVNPKTHITDAAGTLVYMAPESFWGYNNQASDVFSAGIIFYHMITGMPPWLYDFSKVDDDQKEIENVVLLSRKKTPTNPSSINKTIDGHLEQIILQAINQDQSKRFKDASDFLNALINYENKKSSINKNNHRIQSNKKDGGFKDVAGMDELKSLLYSEIVLPLQQKDLFTKYRINLPNGILLYGPPGCGKTYITKKLAEEVNYTFIEVKPSDLASVYVHGSQKKIGELFKKARENSPAIIFFDEIDALIPKRSDRLEHHYSSEVNEFLSQLSECGVNNIVVIGTTNQPNHIDPAALRTGRFDKLIYVPPPDFNARVELFKMFLKDRPMSKNIKIELLAHATENYVASDIETIVNQVARIALKEKGDISFRILLDVISATSPSVTNDMLDKYKNISLRNNQS